MSGRLWRSVPQGCSHYCEQGHFTGDDMTMMDIDAHARGVAEERARWTVEALAVAMRKGWGPYWLTETDDYGQPYEYLDVDKYARAILAAMAPSSPQDGPSAPEGDGTA
jgi:hypothetical protein